MSELQRQIHDISSQLDQVQVVSDQDTPANQVCWSLPDVDLEAGSSTVDGSVAYFKPARS